MDLSVIYITSTTIVFLSFAFLLLVPNNLVLPLDRRLGGLFFSAICTCLVWLCNPSHSTGMPGDDIDVNVLVILLSIMVINFVLMGQSFVQRGVKFLQTSLRQDLLLAHDSGWSFWCVSLIAFAASPFITNDGLCLLLVDPVLDAFDR